MAPGKLPCTWSRRCQGGRSGCPHPGCANLGKAHTGWEGRQREVKLFARGHPEGRWFKCRHSFPRPRHGWELNFTQNSPLSPAARGHSAVGSLGLTSDGCWWMEFGVTRLKIPCGCLSSTLTPRAGAAASPAQGRAGGVPRDSHSLAVQGHGSCCLETGFSSLRTKDFHFWGAADCILHC